MTDTERDRLVRMETKLDALQSAVQEIKDGQRTGCPFGQAQAERITRHFEELGEIKAELWDSGGLKDRVIDLEQTRATWTAKWGGSIITLTVIGQMITLAVAIYATAN